MKPLNDREMDVLMFISDGLTHGEIALEMHLSRTAVTQAARTMKAKFGARTQEQAVALAYHRRVLIVPPLRDSEEAA